MDSLPLWIGIVVASSLAAAGLVVADPRRRLVLVGLALLIAPVLIAGDNWHTDRFVDLRGSPAVLAAGLLLALATLVVLVLLVRRFPGWLPIALVAVLPFRIPIDLGGDTSNLLLPLYALLAAGLIAALLEPGRVLPALAERGGPGAGLADPRRWLAPVLATILVLYGLQAGYTDDAALAAENVAFFHVPFAALFVLLAGARWGSQQIRRLVIVLAAAALLVALVAFGQYATGGLFWNDKVIDGNEAHAYFRVNSVFYDPNIMGRFLDIALVVLAGVVAWGGRRQAWAAALAFAVVLLALVITFSQSSLLALLAGLLVIAAGRWGLLRGIAAAALVALALAVSVLAIDDGGLTAETSGRTDLISGGAELAEERPLAGYGAGSFPAEFRERFEVIDEGYAVESHTEPITVAAEQGAIGLIPYVALLGVATLGLWAAAGLGLRGVRDPVALVLLAAFAALVVHSLGYAAFLTDPLTWAVLALALALPGAAGAGVRARAPSSPEASGTLAAAPQPPSAGPA